MSTGGPADPGREAIVAALEGHRVEYVVIGGAAAQARGWPEPTDDIDLTPERSEGNLSRLATAVEELDAGFRVDPARYPEGYRPPDGIDWRTFRNQVSVAFTTRHGNFDVVLLPDGTKGYEEITWTRGLTRAGMRGFRRKTWGRFAQVGRNIGGKPSKDAVLQGCPPNRTSIAHCIRLCFKRAFRVEARASDLWRTLGSMRCPDCDRLGALRSL
jgi:hypothetical protein